MGRFLGPNHVQVEDDHQEVLESGRRPGPPDVEVVPLVQHLDGAVARGRLPQVGEDAVRPHHIDRSSPQVSGAGHAAHLAVVDD